MGLNHINDKFWLTLKSTIFLSGPAGAFAVALDLNIIPILIISLFFLLLGVVLIHFINKNTILKPLYITFLFTIHLFSGYLGYSFVTYGS